MNITMRGEAGKGRDAAGVARASSPQGQNGTLTIAGRFMLVGVLNTVLDVGLYTALRVLLGVPVLPANTIAYGAGIVNSFWWNRAWTYAHRPRRAVAAQFAQFAVVSLSALLANTLLVVLLSPWFSAWSGHPAAGDMSAKLCATAVGLGWNFLANNAWTFRAGRGSG